MVNRDSHARRSLKVRSIIKQSKRPRPRLSVHKTAKHIYVQLISEDGTRTLASASTVDSDVRKAGGTSCNVASAKIVGKFIAERAQKANIKQVAFDRSGYKYHGRVRALAEAARESGLDF